MIRRKEKKEKRDRQKEVQCVKNVHVYIYIFLWFGGYTILAIYLKKRRKKPWKKERKKYKTR